MCMNEFFVHFNLMMNLPKVWKAVKTTWNLMSGNCLLAKRSNKNLKAKTFPSVSIILCSVSMNWFWLTFSWIFQVCCHHYYFKFMNKWFFFINRIRLVQVFSLNYIIKEEDCFFSTKKNLKCLCVALAN